METREVKYYESLGMTKDPFSTATDPEFFYPTREHAECILRIERSICSGGGINLILGDPGIGKTMLKRVMQRQFHTRMDDFMVKEIMKPDFPSEYIFLQELFELFEVDARYRSTVEYRNAIDDCLFRKVVEDGKEVVLMIDEGQKLNSFNLNVLQKLLKYQLDGFPLIHLVIFGRMTFLENVWKCADFDDSIDLKYTINPLDPEELKDVIEYRLKIAGYTGTHPLFDDPALHEIWSLGRGNPLKASIVCRDSLISMSMRDSNMVDTGIVRSVLNDWETRW
jgi:general secretion pathway protein A